MGITFGKKKKTEEDSTVKPKRKYAGHVDFDKEEPVVIKTKGVTRKPRKTTPKVDYKPITEGDLYQILISAVGGKGNITDATLKVMKSGFARKPFGGDRRGGGGWNSTAYAIIEAFESSGLIYIKKE